MVQARTFDNRGDIDAIDVELLLGLEAGYSYSRNFQTSLLSLPKTGPRP
jgi:hypothetical protein